MAKYTATLENRSLHQSFGKCEDSRAKTYRRGSLV
jgi:hypothetical protein